MNKTRFISTLIFCSWTACASAAEFTLLSSDISEGQPLSQQQVFAGFGCEGGDKSPHLQWLNPPEQTKSYVITAYDPDAPTGSGWWHWIAFNIPAQTSAVAADASALSKLPKGTIEARNDYGSYGFGGACPPPQQVHRYQFTVHALDVEKLDLDNNASAALIGYMTKVHTIDSATITAVYTR